MGNGRFTSHWGYGVYYFMAGKPASSGERVKKYLITIIVTMVQKPIRDNPKIFTKSEKIF